MTLNGHAQTNYLATDVCVLVHLLPPQQQALSFRIQTCAFFRGFVANIKVRGFRHLIAKVFHLIEPCGTAVEAGGFASIFGGPRSSVARCVRRACVCVSVCSWSCGVRQLWGGSV